MARCDCGPMFPKSKVHKCPLLCKGDSGPNGPLLLWSNIPKDRVHVSFIVQRRQRAPVNVAQCSLKAGYTSINNKFEEVTDR